MTAEEKRRGKGKRKPTKEKGKGEEKRRFTIWVYIRKLKRQFYSEKNKKKKIFLQFLPFGVAHVNSYSERCNQTARNNTLKNERSWLIILVPKPKTITHKELHKLAREARGYAKKIYLHWTAGNYNDAYDDYHFNIGKDGELYITCKTLLETKSHTYNRNKESVSIALCCCAEGRLYGHGRVDFGEQPPTPVQLEKMSQVIAILAHALEIDITFSNVMTHAEAAFMDGYGPGSGDKEMRWDLWYLPDLPFNRAMRPGGTALREKAQWYYDYYFKSEMFN